MQRSSTAETPSSVPDPLAFTAFESDPLATMLRDTIGLSPLRLAVAAFVYSLMALVATIGIYAVGFPSVSVGDFVARQGWAGFGFQLVAVPLLFSFYGWMCLRSGTLFAALFRTGVFGGDEAAFKAEVVESQGIAPRVHGWAVWTPLAAVVTTITLVAFGVVGHLSGQWVEAQWVWNLMLGPITIVGVFAVCMIVARHLSTLVSLWRVFRSGPVRLRPFDPDRAGGLKPLGDYAISVGYVIATAGVALALLSIQSQLTGSLQSNYLVLTAWGVYVILAPLSFFATLGAAHGAMRKAKVQCLLLIAQQFDREYDLTVTTLQTPGTNIGAQVERVRHLDALYELTNRFPIWPFDTVTLGRFFTIMAAPIAAVLVSLLTTAAKRWI